MGFFKGRFPKRTSKKRRLARAEEVWLASVRNNVDLSRERKLTSKDAASLLAALSRPAPSNSRTQIKKEDKQYRRKLKQIARARSYRARKLLKVRKGLKRMEKEGIAQDIIRDLRRGARRTSSSKAKRTPSA